MQYKKIILSATLSSVTLGAYVPADSWDTLTPTATYKNAISAYPNDFGIAVQPIAVTSTGIAKRQVQPVSQIGDGQIQATTQTTLKPSLPVVSQIGDGQIQATTKTHSTVAAVSQIGDGQIQATTKTHSTVAAVSQIGDGQIQATTKTHSTVAAVSQIGDGQIQATTKTHSTVAAVSQIGDGQIQATTKTHSTVAAVSQIGDGQIQATTRTTVRPHAVSQIGDGQIQATTATHTTTNADNTMSLSVETSTMTHDNTTISNDNALHLNETYIANDPVTAESCFAPGTLSMTLKDGVLIDSHGRIGSIVSNRQFQFDGPPPQAGAIYAGGWSITPEGNLAIGDNDEFWQCLSGSFYNLYDEHIGSACYPIHLQVISLVHC